MPFKITFSGSLTDEQQRLRVIVRSLLFQVTAFPRLLETIDDNIRRHHRKQWGRPSTWGDLSGLTRRLRENKVKRVKTTNRSYYQRHPARVSAPLDPRSFGWTGRSFRALTKRGKFRKNPATLIRDFGGERSLTHRLLRFMHFGSSATVNPKMRKWFLGQRIPLKIGTELKRPERLVYVTRIVRRIVEKRTEQYIETLLAVDERGGSPFNPEGAS